MSRYTFISMFAIMLLITGCAGKPQFCHAPPVRLSDDGCTVRTSYDHIRVVQGIQRAFFRMRWRAKSTHTPEGRDYHLAGFDTKERPIRVAVKEADGVSR